MSFPTGAEGEPLSVFQLQKDIWARAEGLGKARGPIRKLIAEEMESHAAGNF